MARTLPTEHGELALPAFLPDATRGVIRTLDWADTLGCGVQGLCVNTFHLQNRPGATVISAAGGIHGFTGWNGPVLSDSGGFQVFSLLQHDPNLGSVTPKGFIYRAARGGRKIVFTPEKCIHQQFRIGADAIVCLDHCVWAGLDPDAQRQAVENTVRWARRCREAYEHEAANARRRPLLFAVVQGGNRLDMRRECAERLAEIGFDGYGFGGWPVDGEGRLVEAVQVMAQSLPAGSCLWGLGIGKPEHVVASARMGYGLFDCVIPTRDARHGRLYVSAHSFDGRRLSGTDFCRRVYVLDLKHVRADGPLDPHCDCACCTRYSLGYLHHLYAIREPTGHRLGSIHNLRFYARMMQALRDEGA